MFNFSSNKINYFLILFFISSVCFAQTFKLTSDKTTVSVNQTFQVYFELSGADINGANNFQAPAFNGFRILSGPNQSTSMQIINGQVNGSLTYTYLLRGQKKGKFKISKGSISYKGKTFHTNEIEISVVAGNVSQNTNDKTDNGSNDQQEIAKNVFLRAIPNKTTVYKGEQILISYKLYTKLNISSPSISKLPSYKGFWAEDLKMPGNINFQMEMYKGERYRVAEIKKIALFPTQSGKLKVTPFELNVPVLIRKRKSSRSVFDDFFNDPFFGRTETVEFLAISNSLKIDVKNLPSRNVPKNFAGAVGTFSLKANIDKTDLKLNEPVSIKLSLSGKGNIKLIDLPKLKLPTGFEQYDPKVTENISKNNIVAGTKSVEYLLVPRIPGKRKVDAFEFSYFDLNSKKYKTLRTKSFELNVTGSVSEFDEAATGGFSKADVKLLNSDIRFINTSNFALTKIQVNSSLSIWFYLGLIFPPLILILLIILRSRNEKLSSDIVKLKSQKALKVAKKRLKSVVQHLNSGDSNSFYSVLSMSFNNYLEDKLEINKSEFTLELAISKLKSNGVDEEIIESMKSILEKCEFARFSPADAAAEDKMYKQTLETIIKLENAL